MGELAKRGCLAALSLGILLSWAPSYAFACLLFFLPVPLPFMVGHLEANAARVRTSYRPYPIAVFNTLAKAVYTCTGIQFGLDVDTLLMKARKDTGLDLFYNDDLLEPLGVLTRSVDSEARLMPFGRFMYQHKIVGHLSNMLRSAELFRRHPHIITTPVQAPIVIVGLPRTGTTMLHRLLALDDRLRSLASWEAINPAPHVDFSPKGYVRSDDPRRGMANTAAAAVKFLSPQFFCIHPMDPEAPEEECLLMDQSFRGHVPNAMMNVPSYSAWMEKQSMAPCYEDLRRTLQLLQWQYPGDSAPKTWLLKTPVHLEYLDEFVAAYPDARIIMTHRLPEECVTSTISMNTFLHRTFSDDVDPNVTGRYWLDKCAKMVKMGIATREKSEHNNFMDVYYANMIADPLAQVREIYNFLDMSFTPELESIMRASMKENKKDKHGKHRYTLQDFGLSKADLDEAFAEYNSVYFSN